MTLAELPIGAKATITGVRSTSGIVLRLMEMGLVPGSPVEIRKVAPLGDPLELRVRGYALSIRKSEARSFEVHIHGSTL